MLQNEKLFKFVSETDYSQISPRLIDHTKLCLLDTIGCTVDGSQPELNILQLVRIMSWSNCREATVIGSHARVSVADAFRSNAYACSCSDFNRGKSFQYMHPGRLLILSALAAGEKLDVSIEELVTAIILSYEVILRVGRALKLIAWPPGEIHPDPEFASYCFSLSGITSIAIKLLGLNNQSGDAIETPPLKRIKGNQISGTSSTIPDIARMNNKVPLLIARIFSLLQGAYDSNTPLSVPADEEVVNKITEKLGDSAELTARLGNRYITADVGFIPTSLCHYIQSPIMTVKKALRGEKIEIDKIQKIELIGLQWLAAAKSKYVEDVAYRMATATALLANNINPEMAWYLNGKLNNTSVKILAGKLNFLNDVNCWINLTSSKNCLFRARVETTDGPLRTAEIIQKFTGIDDLTTEKQFKARFNDYTDDVLGEKKAQKLQIALLENADIRVRNLMKLVRPQSWFY